MKFLKRYAIPLMIALLMIDVLTAVAPYYGKDPNAPMTAALQLGVMIEIALALALFVFSQARAINRSVLAALPPLSAKPLPPVLSSGLPPHQQRVVDEKTELRDRLAKLDAFILDNPVFLSLAEAEQGRLKRQSHAMGLYADILEDRIQHFV